MSKIRLSKKYGVNPTIPICFWCGNEKNEIALMGKIGKGQEDIEAPKHMVLDYQPCEKCKKLMSKGVTLIEVSQSPNSPNQPTIHEGLYPTGSWSVIRRRAAIELLGEEIAKQHGAFIDYETYSMLFSKGEPT